MILVTGATGNLGAFLSFELLKNQDNIICIYRKSSSFDNIKRIFDLLSDEPEKYFSRIIWRQADITNQTELDEIFYDVDYVYHCAAMVNLNSAKYEQAYEINVRGTANIVNACLNHNVKKLLHVSSIAALADISDRLITEKDLLNPALTNSVYSLTKYYGEKEVWRGVEEGLNTIVILPSVILAPYKISGGILKFLKYIKKHGFKHYTTGMKGYIDVQDVVKIMIDLMNSDISNEKFLVTAENMRFNEIFTYINEFWGHRPPYKEMSKAKLNLIKNLLKITFFGRKLFTKETVGYLINDTAYSNEKISNATGYKFQSVKDSIHNLLEYYDKMI